MFEARHKQLHQEYRANAAMRSELAALCILRDGDTMTTDMRQAALQDFTVPTVTPSREAVTT